jgi:bifunctional non-homologous end joining protein LigD
LRLASFLIDGEAVVCRPDGVSDFEALRGRRQGAAGATLVAFDLITLQGDDLRNEKLVDRKRRLVKLLAANHHHPAKLPSGAKLLANAGTAIVYNEHLEHDGALVFDHACRMGLEGIVSKRLDAPYRGGPSKTWLKSKNPLSAAMRREREEGLGYLLNLMSPL